MKVRNDGSPGTPVRCEQLSPWALRPTITGPVFRPAFVTEIPQYLQNEVNGGLLAIGARTAYGDACVNPGGYHLATEHLNKMLAFDESSGRVSCRSGVTLKDLLSFSVPRGWFLQVVPGTMRSTVGGAFACDIHGKNHHVQGSFASTVSEIEIITADGQTRECSRVINPELFWATAGGLGQTGIITKLTLQLLKVESAWMVVSQVKTRDLDQTMTASESSDWPYSVSWIDSFARGRPLGRGVLTLARHATADDMRQMSPSLPPFPDVRTTRISLPFFVPRWLTGSLMWRTLNGAYYGVHRTSPQPFLTHFRPYFFPLDGISHWNRIYGRKGFIEYQIAMPAATASAVFREILERLSSSGNGSFVAGIKCFGAGDAGPLSFPIKGYTLAVDMPATGEAQARLLRQLDEAVTRGGGRVYLVKDSRLTLSVVDAMYPRRREWAEQVNGYDPKGIFTSSLVQRLRLRS
jgi:decaprenylphospho-beta-D-ribofuranose 2-oxidase